MLVHENAVVKIRDDMPLDRAALIGCGVTTGAGAALRTANVEAGSTVAVIGCGGVGLSAINGASIAGAGRIIAVDQVVSKLELARQFGATDTVDEKANQFRSDFIADKIRSRVKDQELAKKLIPTDHGFGTKRVPLESGYYEVYNLDNVELIDLRDTPIVAVTPAGIQTTDCEREFDYIFYATGFDPVTGALNRISITGVDGQPLKDKWSDGPLTYLGIQSAGYPNMFTLVGPHNAATLCNIPRCIEQNVDWVTELIQHMQAHGYTSVEPELASEQCWTEEVLAAGADSPFMKVNSWLSGINSNVDGRQQRVF